MRLAPPPIKAASKRDVKKFLGLYVEPEEEATRKTYTNLDTVKAKKLYDKGLNDVMIAEALGVTKTCVGNWRRGEGLPPYRQYKTKSVDEKKRMGLYNKGLSDGKIAELVGVKKNAILRWRRVRNLPPNKAGKKKGQENEA